MGLSALTPGDEDDDDDDDDDGDEDDDEQEGIGESGWGLGFSGVGGVEGLVEGAAAVCWWRLWWSWS